MNPSWKTIVLATGTIFLTLCLIIYPDQAFDSSIRGLNIWWEVVFPSLLPFFIMAELLIGFGIVTFLGVVFEPIMRPIFNVPGVGSFAWVMGMASGYPSGAKISARLREENQITKIEAERLLSFTNASSPLFIFGAISVGFFHDAKLGILLAVCHYLGNTIVGVCMRFHGRSEKKQITKQSIRHFSIRRAFHEMHKTRMNDPRPFGEVVGDAIINSIKTLVMVGGFIILFSVITRMLFKIGILTAVAMIAKFIFTIFSIPLELGVPFITGLFEISLGAQHIALTKVDPLFTKIIIVSFILGFNGFSVQAQVASIIAKTDISFKPYLLARILHSLMASILTVVLYDPLYAKRHTSDVSTITNGEPMDLNVWATILTYLKQIGPFVTIVAIGFAFIIQLRRVK